MKKVGRGIQIESDKGSVTSLHEMMGFEYWKGPQAPIVWIHILFLLLFSFTLDIFKTSYLSKIFHFPNNHLILERPSKRERSRF
jgi:hypothetical protein